MSFIASLKLLWKNYLFIFMVDFVHNVFISYPVINTPDPFCFPSLAKIGLQSPKQQAKKIHSFFNLMALRTDHKLKHLL